MSEFKPTFLYIKRHSITGLMYFGKTQRNPETYLGSGKYWKRHFKKHGKEFVETLWYCLFVDEVECSSFALSFSRQNNIVESVEWANMKAENGLDGNPKGIVFSEDHLNKLKESAKHKPPKTQATRNKLSAALTGRIFSEAHKKNLKESRQTSEKLKSWYSSDECKNVLSAVATGKLWWTDGTTSVKSWIQPGPGWIQAREIIEYKTPKGTFYSAAELNQAYPNVWWKGVWDKLDVPICKHAILFSNGLYYPEHLGKTRREIGFDKIKFPTGSS